jgi:cyclophilin family peptidyl-prolyl cis-trans isomerase
VKRKIVTLLGVVVILVGIVGVRAGFEQAAKTKAEAAEAKEAAKQLEEAAAITEDAEAEHKDDGDEHAGHDHDGGDHDGHDHAKPEGSEEKEEIVIAKAEAGNAATPEAKPEAIKATPGIEKFEEIAEWPAAAPDVFRVKFETTTGPYVIEVTKAWAPIGAERFYELCKVGYFNEAGYFRVIHGFMVQFGLAADPKLTAQYKPKNLMDEPVIESNKRGKITFAKSGAPNSRTTQVFINYGNNANLDGMGFSPFGEVIFGMESVDKITNEYGERPNQGSVTSKGNAYLKARFPNLDYINKVTLVK